MRGCMAIYLLSLASRDQKTSLHYITELLFACLLLFLSALWFLTSTILRAGPLATDADHFPTHSPRFSGLVHEGL
jgi:hypothetical protein